MIKIKHEVCIHCNTIEHGCSDLLLHVAALNIYMVNYTQTPYFFSCKTYLRTLQEFIISNIIIM